MTWECLVKFRDGCFDESEIASLAHQLTTGAQGTRWAIVGFPEVTEDGCVGSLHVIQAIIQGADHPDPLCIPEEPREPLIEVPGSSNMTARFKTSGTHIRPNTSSRHQQFVAWLTETYGIERLRSGSGVLDVAGGAGGVAFELAFRRGVPCVVIDPRPMRLTSKQRRALRNRVSSQAVLGSKPPPTWWLGGAGNTVGCDLNGEMPDPSVTAADVDANMASHGIMQDTPLPHATIGALKPATGCISSTPTSLATFADDTCSEVEALPHVPESYAIAWQEEGLPVGCLPRQVCGHFDESFAIGPHRALWETCSVVVGMHPDQATEPIVRLALAHGKPFAVVPCCVFANTNAHRRLPNGKRVRTHLEFCDYLEYLGRESEAHVEHAPRSVCRRTELSNLSFEGRNIIVFSRPDEQTSFSARLDKSTSKA